MSGNVAEYCEDLYNEDAYSKHQHKNPIYTGVGLRRVNRGGGGFLGPFFALCTSRFFLSPGTRASGNGFRLARTR